MIKYVLLLLLLSDFTFEPILLDVSGLKGDDWLQKRVRKQFYNARSFGDQSLQEKRAREREREGEANPTRESIRVDCGRVGGEAAAREPPLNSCKISSTGRTKLSVLNHRKAINKNVIRDACSTADCFPLCLLLSIVAHCCPLLPIVVHCCPPPPRSAMIYFTIDCHIPPLTCPAADIEPKMSS